MLVKTHFTLPGLHGDIQEIVAGHGQRAERLYDTVVSEIVELAADADAENWKPDDGSGAQNINRPRLDGIKAQYRKLHNKDFSPGFLMRHLAGATRGERNPELLAAIEAYITDTQLDIADSARELIAFKRGENTSPEVQKKAAELEGRLAHYGYDAASFESALHYWSILTNGKAAQEAKK